MVFKQLVDLHFLFQGLNAYRNYAENINRQFYGDEPDHTYHHHHDLATSHSHQYSRYDQAPNSPTSSVAPLIKNAWTAYQKYSQHWVSPFNSVFNQISERQEPFPFQITPLGLFYVTLLGVVTIGAGYYQAVQEEDERRRQASASTVRTPFPLHHNSHLNLNFLRQKYTAKVLDENF